MPVPDTENRESNRVIILSVSDTENREKNIQIVCLCPTQKVAKVTELVVCVRHRKLFKYLNNFPVPDAENREQN